MARLACYLGGLALGLYALEKLLGLLSLSWGGYLGGWVGFLAFVAGVLFFILGFRWVKRRILWRLRNRLIVTYMFIGVIPAVLLVGMGLITLYGLGDNLPSSSSPPKKTRNYEACRPSTRPSAANSRPTSSAAKSRCPSLWPD